MGKTILSTSPGSSGLSVKTSPEMAGIPCDFWAYSATTAVSSQNTNAADIYFVLFWLDSTVTFTKMSVLISVASANKLFVGIYDETKTKLIRQATFVSTAS